MMKSIAVVAAALVLGLASVACADAPEAQPPVVSEVDGIRASSVTNDGVITTTLEGKDARALAIVEWNVANGTARMRLLEKGISVAIRPSGAAPTMETANVMARRAYEIGAAAEAKPAAGSPGSVEPRLLEAFCVSCHAVGQSDICCGWDFWC
jgi:hypothetical protein